MAAPTERTVRDLNGIWVLNKTLSDDMRPLLKLQGISWFLRQAITLATISLHTVQTPTHPQTNTPTNSSPASPSPSAAPTDVVITIQNVANMGLKGTTEIRHLDWQWREHWDYIWGQVRGRCGFKATRDVVDERLREGWMEETLQGECIQEDAMAGGDEEGKGWESTMIWGFQNVNEIRRYVRRVVVRRRKNHDEGGDNSDDESVSVRLVYDYQGPVSIPTSTSTSAR